MVVKATRRLTEDGRYLFSVDDYYKMAEIGVFDEDSRVELLGGEVFAMSPIGSRHAACVSRLLALFFRQLDERAIVSAQNPVRLSDDSEPEPDISLLRPKADFYASHHPGPDDVLLIVEVADTSLGYDRDVKLGYYARAGIPEVWIVDLTAEEVVAYLSPEDDRYRETRELRRGGSLTASAFPDVTLPFEAIVG